MNFVSNNEDFISLLQLCSEDPDIRSKVAAIVALEPTHRSRALDHLLKELVLARAPASLVSALSCLKNPDVATEVQHRVSQP